MKDGLYITVDSKGIQDVGARVAFETSTAIGPGVSVATPIDSMDFSIMDISFVPSVPGGRSARSQERAASALSRRQLPQYMWPAPAVMCAIVIVSLQPPKQ
jgi:hypothetical protein